MSDTPLADAMKDLGRLALIPLVKLATVTLRALTALIPKARP